MMRFLESLAGAAVVVIAVACMPYVTRKPGAALPTTVCAAPLERAPMLCNRILRDGFLECALCNDPNRGCTTTTHLYCAASCDDPACVPRGRR